MRYFSTFSGIGGFELGIELAYETIRSIDVSSERGGKEDEERELQEDGKRLYSVSSQRTPSTNHRDNELSDGSFDEGQPNCIGYSEVDKYATQIYQKHFRQPRERKEIIDDLDEVKTIISKNNYDIIDVCYVNTAKKETSFIKITSQNVKTALDDTSLSGVRTILKKVGRQGENIMLCEDKECSICMGEDVLVAESQKRHSLPLNIKTMMDTLTEKDMELAICIKLPSKNIDQNDMRYYATTVITLKEDTIYAHIKRQKPPRNFGDITKISTDTLPDFDLLVGGFPCQAFSIAGKRKGFEDTRGTLFFELARILSAKRPRLFLFENVKGLLSHDDGNTFKTIISTLDELGYDCQWQVLNSKNHGVPQNRERVFIVGHLRGTPRPQVFPFARTDEEDTRINGRDIAYTIDANYSKGTNTLEKARRSVVLISHPKYGNGLERSVDYVESDTVPTIRATHYKSGDNQPIIKIPEATKKGYAEATVGQSINLSVPNSKTRRGRVSDLAQTLDTGMQQHTLTEDARVRRLTPRECALLQGFPIDWHEVEGISDTQAYKCYGNAVTTYVIRDIVSKLI